jgi:hypothetical protein
MRAQLGIANRQDQLAKRNAMPCHASTSSTVSVKNKRPREKRKAGYQKRSINKHQRSHHDRFSFVAQHAEKRNISINIIKCVKRKCKERTCQPNTPPIELS